MMNLLTLGQSSLPMKAIEIEREYPTTKVKIRPSTSGAMKGLAIGASIGRSCGAEAAVVGAVIGGCVGACVGPED